MSILKRIRDVLKQNKIDSYFPEQHKGECLKPYVVVKSDGAISLLTVSSERPVYTIVCHVPKERYSDLETYVLKVKKAMKNMYPLLVYEGNETPTFYDIETKSHMVSFQYLGCRRINYH